MQKYWMILALVSMLMVSPCVAQTSQAHQDLGHVMRTPTQIQWQPGPASLPPGAQLAVLDGDPSQAGMAYTIGLKMPDGYRVPPHWHPMDASVIVVQGSFIMGLGEKVEPAEAQELTPGSYMRVSKEVRHYEWTKGDTIIYVYGLGPLDTIYVNPADDPRQKANRKSEKGS